MATMAYCGCSSSALFSSSTVICRRSFSSSPSLVHTASVASSSLNLPHAPPHNSRRRKYAAPLVLSSRCRHRHLAASAGLPPSESDGSSSNSSFDDDEEKSSISPLSSTFSGILVTFIRIRDRLSVFFAVLFWICLFFWASVFDNSDGGKPNKRPWFRR